VIKPYHNVGGLPDDMALALVEPLWEASNMGEVGRYLLDIMGGFKFDGIGLTLPTKTFEST
jgi:hypothetical protein